MEVQLGGPPVPAEAPPGVRLRTVDPDIDLPVVHRMLEAAMADHWDALSTSYEDFIDQNVRHDDFDPSLWWLALDGDEAVGALIGSIQGDRGVVELVGVLRPHRGRGIASTLLRVAFDEFERRGAARVRLNVDSENPTGAVRIYERLGMRPVDAYDLWERPISGRRRRLATRD
jgi:ribosomal protein S18 acetylase RimI-like enzyme